MKILDFLNNCQDKLDIKQIKLDKIRQDWSNLGNKSEQLQDITPENCRQAEIGLAEKVNLLVRE